MRTTRLEQGIQRLKKAVEARTFVVAAYLFGSQAAGTAGKLSDIDLGFYLREGLGKRELVRRELELANLAEECFGGENDVVIMNEAELPLNFHIISGRLLASTDERARIAFEARIMRDYLDDLPHQRLRAAVALKRVAKRGLA